MADATAFPEQRKRHPQSVQAEERFLRVVASLGATPLYGEWRGSDKPHLIRCANGHETLPWPSSLYRGQGPCRECVGIGSEGAWLSFRRLVAEGGGTVMEEGWKGAIKPHQVRCAQGHITSPTPRDAKSSGSFCRVCAGRDSASAWDSFRAFVAEGGGTVQESEWLGTHKLHRIVCRNDHATTVRPSKVMSRRSIPCKACRYEELAAQYVGMVTNHGGTPLEPYQGSAAKHRIRCAKGHDVRQTPAHLMAGHALCRRCAYKEWDAFYLVRDNANDLLKFGITSGNPHRRLKVHAKDGFDVVVRLHVGLPGNTAPELERTIIAALRDAREAPVRGREYYRGGALALVLDLVDNHPDVRSCA